MSALAVRYKRKTPRHEVQVSAPKGAVTHVHLPDEDAKAHFVTALLKARCEPGEELELFGEVVSSVAPKKREKLRHRVGAVSPVVGLMSNLNAWENIALPAAYHGAPPLPEVAQLASDVLTALGAEPSYVFARLPDELGLLDRKIAAFVRLLVAAPELLVLDALEDGLSYGECRQAARLEAEYRARRPDGTVVYVDTKEES
jgi:ABC-type transporter Mla maintaining outer membrane lipid asymmetry ATPase subunit MlaF